MKRSAVAGVMWLGVASAWLAAPLAAQEQANPVLDELLTLGVPLADGQHVRLPAPTMADGLSTAAQQQVLASIADERRPVEALVRRAVVAPFVLRMQTLKGPDGKPTTARSVDVWFVAHGEMKLITSEGVLEFLRDLNGDSEAGAAPTSGFLDEAEVARRQLLPPGVDALRERYFYNTFELFDRVEITATRRSILTATGESLLVAIQLDPRFNGDAAHPNQWRSLKRDELGKLQAGPPQPYASAGSYLKLTAMAAHEEALFIEYHLVFDEPQGWFNGANLIRSKVPVLVEDTVRKARRRLAKTLAE